MKKLLIAVFFSFLSLGAMSQARVIALADTAQFGIETDKLENQYRVKRQRFEDGYFQKSMQYSSQLFHSEVTRHFKRYRKGFYANIRQYVNQDGKIDLILYDIEDETVPDSVRVVFLEKLQNFANAYQDTLKYVSVSFNYSQVGIINSLRQLPKSDSTLTEVAQAEQTARPDTVKVLSLNGLALQQVPGVIYRFANLEQLNLAGNELESVDIDIARLPKLRLLYLGGNNLTDGSLSLTSNKSLKILNLQNNKFTDIPDAVRANKGLTSLWLGGNSLENLNNGSFRKMRQLQDINFYKSGLKKLPRGVAKLKSLEVMDLYYNDLTELPKSLRKLKKMQQLALSYNQLQTLPRQLSQLPNLHTFYAHHNRLGQLPKNMGNLKSLRLLDLNHNLFNEFPLELVRIATLQDLDLSNNNLSEIPTEIIQMRELKKLFVNGNPFLQDANLMSRTKPVLHTLQTNKIEVHY
jgi:Leucine-rich repeat (LRR) protein